MTTNLALITSDPTTESFHQQEVIKVFINLITLKESELVMSSEFCSTYMDIIKDVSYAGLHLTN